MTGAEAAGGLAGAAPQTAAWAALVVAGPMLLAAAVQDLRRMRIPNGLNAALALAFIPVGLAFLPPETVAWRLGAGLIVLALGYALFALGKMGGGDVKMLAACTPWIAAQDAALALQLLAVALLAGVGVIYPLRAALASGQPAWRGLRKGARFPMGVSIAAALLILLALRAAGALA